MQHSNYFVCISDNYYLKIIHLSIIFYSVTKDSWHILHVAVTTMEHRMLSITCVICIIGNT